jgi:diguanylate cyclase (GGDEF)-like protein/PAS domain S-box-containing protein
VTSSAGFDDAPFWDYRIGPDGRYLFVSSACQGICGYPAQAFMDDATLLERLLHPEDAVVWRRHLRETLHGSNPGAAGCSGPLELRLAGADGRERWIEHRCLPLFDATGTFIGRRGIHYDITRHKGIETALARTTRLYATLGAFNEALLHATSQEVLFGELCRIAVDVGGLAGCVISLNRVPGDAGEPGGRTLVPVASAGIPFDLAANMPDYVGVEDPASLPPQRAFELEREYLCTDCRCESVSAAWREWAAQIGVTACFHEPIRRDERKLGVVSFLARRAEDLQPGLLDLLRSLTRNLTIGLRHHEQRGRERAHLEALRRNEAHLKALIQATPVGVGLVRGSCFQEVNDFLCELSGHAREELVGGSTQLIYPADAELDTLGRQRFDTFASSGHVQMDTVLLRRDGQLIDVVLSLAPLDPTQPDLGLVSTVLDVTAARRAQALLEARVELSAVADSGGLEALLDRALDIARRLTRSDYARVQILADDIDRARGTPPMDPEAGDSVDGQALPDPLDGPSEPWRESRRLPGAFVRNSAVQAQGGGTLEVDARALVVPVVRGDALVAVIELAGKPADYTGDDLEMVAQLAGMATDTVERVRTDRALHQANERLLEAQGLARVGDWHLDVASGRLEWSRQVYRIFGLDPDRAPPDLDAHRQLIHPRDVAAFEADLGRALASGEPYARDWRAVRPDGTLRHVHAVCHPERDAQGRIIALHGTAQDITERKNAEQALADARARLELALEGGALGLYDADLVDGTVRLEGRALALFGLESQEAPPSLETWRSRIHDDDRARVAAALAAVPAGEGGRLELEYRARDANDRWLWVLDRARVYAWDADEQPLAIAGTLMDITERKTAEERLRQAARVFESTTEGVMITDLDGAIVAVNDAFTTITGYSEQEALGRNPRMLSSGRHDRDFYLRLWHALRERGQWRGEVWNRRKDGEVFPEWLTISAVLDNDGHTSHYVAVFSDITAIKQSQVKLDFLAHHDALTALPNRLLLRDRLDHAVARARREQTGIALLFLDLDGFKGVNDTLGHAVGDQLLVAVAERLTGRLRASDTLARLGGDEFLVLIEDEPQAEDAAVLANALLALLSAPFAVGDHELFISASIGVSFYPDDGADSDALMRSADLAMYRAKATGRNNFQFYTPAMTEHAQERHALENALRGAVARGELHVQYQPQVEIQGRRLVGVEALARWQHPRLGAVSPARFIPVAEEIGIVTEIGDWVLGAACRQVAAWRAQGLAVGSLSVNISVQQLERDSLPQTLRGLLAETGLAPADLELEVTESMIMGKNRRAVESMDALRGLGVRLAVDDFGTGYSSLGRLNRMPIDRLKIDASFVRDISADSKDEAIARAIIGIGRDLGLEVIAEGVEREEQAAFLMREGCRVAQGYLFGHPLPPEDLLRTWGGEAGADPPG